MSLLSLSVHHGSGQELDWNTCLYKLLWIPLGVAQSSFWTMKMSIIRDGFNKSDNIHLVEYSNIINCKLTLIGTESGYDIMQEPIKNIYL